MEYNIPCLIIIPEGYGSIRFESKSTDNGNGRNIFPHYIIYASD